MGAEEFAVADPMLGGDEVSYRGEDDPHLELLQQLVSERHQKPPDWNTQLRQWLGLLIALGGIAWLISAGRQIGAIEEKLTQQGEATEEIQADFREFVKETRASSDSLVAILRTIEQRTATLEGIERGRRDQR